jgi:hypothetical protein
MRDAVTRHTAQVRRHGELRGEARVLLADADSQKYLFAKILQRLRVNSHNLI